MLSTDPDRVTTISHLANRSVSYKLALRNLGDVTSYLEGCCRSGASRVTSATGPYARRCSEDIAMRYVKESQRSRWPRAVVTRRAQGGCGAIRRQNSSPML